MNTMQILMASNFNASVNMAEAYVRLRAAFPTDIRFSNEVSSLAINKAGDIVPEGGQYINAICLAQTTLQLESVTNMLKSIEAELGRAKGVDVAIDLDLVVWNGEVLRPWEVDQAFYRECLLSLNGNQG